MITLANKPVYVVEHLVQEQVAMINTGDLWGRYWAWETATRSSIFTDLTHFHTLLPLRQSKHDYS